MHLVRFGRTPALFMTVAILLCCQIEAQNPKNKVKPKVEPSQSTPEPVVAKPDLSKEFMVLGRKAFAAVDRLNEHLLDSKVVISHGNIMELSDEKESWVLRATTAEQASDDLQAVAESPTEKLIARTVTDAVSFIQRNHGEIDTKTEIAVHGWNSHVLRFEAEGLSSLYLGTSDVPAARLGAMDRATSTTKELLSSPCYLAAKETVSTGVLRSCDPPQNSASAATSELTPEERYVSQLKYQGKGITVRAEGHTLIYAIERPTDRTVALFQEAIDSGSFHRLRSFGFLQFRLEAGGRIFEWPIK
jgi:hypothetical protein